MFGQTVFKKKEGIANGNNSLFKIFHNVMLLSGTPAWYQKDLTKAFPNNVCECSIKTAIENNWVEKPILNLVRLGFEGGSSIYANAIIHVLKYEKRVIQPTNGVRLLVNFGGIDEIGYFLEDEYVKRHIGKDFHFITIHSNKAFKDGLFSTPLISKIDGIVSSAAEVYDLIECIDSGKSEDSEIQKKLDQILDGKPIVVGQVAMIGEGINIKSFSSVITKTVSETTAMQQIGRVLRKYDNKVWPNVYCVYDNVDELKELLSNLMLEHDLTNECFKWGHKIEVMTGSSKENENDDDSPFDRADPNWLPIDENADYDIVNIQYSEGFEGKKLSKTITLFSEQDIFAELCKQMQSKFDKDTLRKIGAKLKTSDAELKYLSKTLNKSKQQIVKGTKENLEPMKMADQPLADIAENNDSKVINETTPIEQVATTEPAVAEETNIEEPSTAEKKDTKSQVTIEDCAKTVIEITKRTMLFINKHRNDKIIVENAKKDLVALTQYLFSYQADLATAIIESDICNNEIFRNFVFSKCK